MTDSRPAYSDRALWIMGAYGFVAGLPLPLSAFTLRQWLTENDTSLQNIGFTASIGLAYVLKFLWAPLLDHVPPPAWAARFGRRRGWLLWIQPLLVGAILALACTDPRHTPYLLVTATVMIAFLSASQDVVIDAWRIETFAERQQGVALAAYIWGYRIALLVAGAGTIGMAKHIGWPAALSGVAMLAAIGVAVTLIAPEPPRAIGPTRLQGFDERLRTAVIEPFLDFWRRPGAGQILAFVMLFNLGQALAHTMANPFYRDMGFDPAQVALAVGLPGLAASLLGAVAGGWLVIRIGTGRALVTTGFVQMASMGLYFALAVSGGDTRVLVAKVVLENFADAMADAAFITYLSALCSSAFTATQYALLSSLAAVGLRTVGGLSGVLAAALGWVPFYALTILAAAPAMVIMVGLLRRFPPPLAAKPSP
ncbi:MAG: MFS transporter [Gemmatimonadaceae bacterium]|nr:MFS transporter [Acetobacteraceae bacterium]